MRKPIFFVVVFLLALGFGVNELLSTPTLRMEYTPPDSGLFAELPRKEKTELLAAALQHARAAAPAQRTGMLTRHRMEPQPDGSLSVRDTAALHRRYRLYLDSLSGSVVDKLADLPSDHPVVIRLRLLDPGRTHRDMLYEAARLEEAVAAIRREVLAEGESVAPYPHTGEVEVAAAPSRIARIGPLLDRIDWRAKPYGSLEALYAATNTAHHFEAARELAETEYAFPREATYQALAERLDEDEPWIYPVRGELEEFFRTGYAKPHYPLLDAAGLVDNQYIVLPQSDPNWTLKEDSLCLDLARLLRLRAVREALDREPVRGAGVAVMALFWADRLERGDSPYFTSTPGMREIGAAAIADVLRETGDRLTADMLREINDAFSIRMTPYRRPWPASRYLPEDSGDPLAAWVNAWRREQEERYWRRGAMSQAQVELLRIEIALARYRKGRPEYPARLEQLVPQYLSTIPMDPLTGGPFHYETNGLTHTLYTVGYDGDDDEMETRCDSADLASDGDWAWRIFD